MSSSITTPMRLPQPKKIKEYKYDGKELTMGECLQSLSGLNGGKNMPHNETPSEFYSRFLLFSQLHRRIVPKEFRLRLETQCSDLISRRAGLIPKKKNLELFEDDTPLERPTSLNPTLHQMILWISEHHLEYTHPQTALCAAYRVHGTACLGAEDSITFRRAVAAHWGLRSVPSLATECQRAVPLR